MSLWCLLPCLLYNSGSKYQNITRRSTSTGHHSKLHDLDIILTRNNSMIMTMQFIRAGWYKVNSIIYNNLQTILVHCIFYSIFQFITHFSSLFKSLGYLNELEQLECLRSEDTPAASWLPILLSHIGSQVKRKQSQSYKFKEFVKISNFLNFETNFTRDTPSEVAW